MPQQEQAYVDEFLVRDPTTALTARQASATKLDALEAERTALLESIARNAKTVGDCEAMLDDAMARSVDGGCVDSALWHKIGAPAKDCAWVANYAARCAVKGEEDGHLGKSDQDTRVAFAWLTQRTAKARPAAPPATDKTIAKRTARVRKSTGERVYLVDEPPAKRKKRASS